MYDVKDNLIEEGNLGDFDINKCVPEGYTLAMKVHFKIEALNTDIKEITVQARVGAIVKSASDNFTVLMKKK